MKNKLTQLMLLLSLAVIAVVTLVFSSFIVLDVYNNWDINSEELDSWRYPIIFVISSVVITFLAALGQIWKLLRLVGDNNAFSQASVDCMKKVKYCGFIIAALFTTLSPLVLYAAESDDAPGLILIFGVVFIGVPFVVAILAGVAQQLFQNAIDLKKENDLTV